MANNTAVLDEVFKALSDPTRRAVIGRLALGPASVSELAGPFPMALPSFVQHLRVLEGAGLIRSHKHGRIRTCELEAQTIDSARAWLDRQRVVWRQRLDQLDQYAQSLDQQEDTL